MEASAQTLRDLSPERRDHVLGEVASALRNGDLAVMPTETVYGVGANAASPQAVERLDALTRTDSPAPIRFTLHAPDLPQGLDLPTPVHHRLLDRLLPGPVRFLIQQPKATLGELRSRLGVAPGMMDDDEYLALRVPDHAVTRDLLERAQVPIVMERLGATPWGADERTAPELPADDRAAVAWVVDDGPTPLGSGSTSVRLDLDGRFEIVGQGAVEERAIMAALERTVLFVCTGNTCRSPMAEGIARHMLASRAPSGVTTRVVSAGAGAAEGSPASPEAVEVLAEMGIDIAAHRARRLTASLIASAETIFVMTPSHRDAVLAIEPDAVDRVFDLDPLAPVPDPIGMPVDVYRETARTFAALLEARLAELEDDA